ncbi:MAG: hypothetical protein OEV94_05640 [Deltaproteobacteria bacterium]|nr:hypothetical protein [Deltaproteobacteria bacterium]
MMIAAIHIVGISVLAAIAGSVGYNIGMKEGQRRQRLAAELNAEEKRMK